MAVCRHPLEGVFTGGTQVEEAAEVHGVDWIFQSALPRVYAIFYKG